MRIVAYLVYATIYVALALPHVTHTSLNERTFYKVVVREKPHNVIANFILVAPNDTNSVVVKKKSKINPQDINVQVTVGKLADSSAYIKELVITFEGKTQTFGPLYLDHGYCYVELTESITVEVMSLLINLNYLSNL